MSKQYAVIGLGRFGMSVGANLATQGHEVLGIDESESLVHAASSVLTHVIQADATDEEALKAMGLRNFDAVIVAIGSDLEASILVTLLLKEMGVPLVIAKASTDLQGRVLQKIGADRVVYPERDMGARVAHSLLATNILDYIELSPKYSILEIEAPPQICGKTLKELNLRNRYSVNVMAIKRGHSILATPKAEDVIMSGDILVVIGPHDGLRNLEKLR